MRMEGKTSTFLLRNHRLPSIHLVGAMMEAYGYTFKGYTRPSIYTSDRTDLPWCNDDTRRVIMSSLSYMFAEVIMSPWNDSFQRYKAMINSVYEGHDKVEEFDRLHGRHRSCCAIL